jgi:hypothetical protein
VFRSPREGELKEVDKMLFSNAYMHSSNYYIPEDRKHLERKLDNLVGDVNGKCKTRRFYRKLSGRCNYWFPDI